MTTRTEQIQDENVWTSRIDIRILTDLPATVVHFSDAKIFERKVHFFELSLSSGLLNFLPLSLQEQFLINIKLPEQGELNFAGELIKNRDGYSIVRFFFPKKQVINSLWSYLRPLSVVAEICPYCSKYLNGEKQVCRNCNRSLAFMEQGYLDRHLQATFGERILNRINRLDLAMMQKIISIVDTELIDIPTEALFATE